MGRQVRHRHQVQRFDYAPSLDAFRRQEYRRLRDDEHGGARHARRVRRRHHRLSLWSAITPTATTPLLVRHNLTWPRSPASASSGRENRLPISVRARHGDSTASANRSKRVKFVNTSDSDIAQRLDRSPASPWWSPGSRWCRRSSRRRDVKVVFNSSQIPGEILDLCGSHRSTEPARRLRAEIRESHRRRLVRTDEPDVGYGRTRRQSTASHRGSFARHAGILQRATRHHAYVLHAAIGGCR